MNKQVDTREGGSISRRTEYSNIMYLIYMYISAVVHMYLDVHVNMCYINLIIYKCD
jgi:hypothetical protein